MAGNAGKGRKKGSKNKVPAALKDMVLHALDDAGGTEYLRRQADENPTAFMALLGRIIPAQMQHTGEIDHNVRQIERSIRYPEDRDGSDLRPAPPPLPI